MSEIKAENANLFSPPLDGDNSNATEAERLAAVAANAQRTPEAIAQAIAHAWYNRDGDDNCYTALVAAIRDAIETERIKK